jgi:hypothetical protein
VHPTKPLTWSKLWPDPNEVITAYECDGTIGRDGHCVEYEQRLRELERERRP